MELAVIKLSKLHQRVDVQKWCAEILLPFVGLFWKARLKTLTMRIHACELQVTGLKEDNAMHAHMAYANHGNDKDLRTTSTYHFPLGQAMNEPTKPCGAVIIDGRTDPLTIYTSRR